MKGLSQVRDLVASHLKEIDSLISAKNDDSVRRNFV
jgi:hypothetical protein